ncbi:MAG: redoxin family protein [Actinomycetota bacterium]|nr:redoxin family protein [Actinomycetota bacterium]
MNTHNRIATGLALLSLLVGSAGAQRPAIGDPVASMSFVDIRYLPRSLRDFGERRAYVLFTVTTTCPLAGRILPRVQRLADDLASDGVQFAAINVGREDSVVDMAAQAVELGIDFPFVKDFDGETLAALGVERTCTAVVLDADRRLRYRGRVDGAFRLSGPSPRPGREDLRHAIADVLADRPVEVTETPVEGCAVRLAPPSAPTREGPFTRAGAPIAQRHCLECHRDGAEAPFALRDYDDFADRADMIAEVVRQRRMPPWFAHRGHLSFENDRRLTDEERQTILDWANGDRARGDSSDLPPPREFPQSEWRIGDPDLVLKVPVPIRVPAEGYVPYRYYVLPFNFKQDTWVQEIEIRPTNKRVLHHANLAYVAKGLRYGQEGFITGQVPGGRPMQLDPGTAVLIPAGSTLALQCHYVTTGKPEVDRLYVGLTFPRVEVERRLRCMIVSNSRFAIAAGASAHQVKSSRTFKHDAVGLGLFSHMHLRGRDMTFRVRYPDGRDEVLLMIPNYSFDWQDAYVLPFGKLRFPAGTRMEVTAHFDNSEFNPFNPDPGEVVKFGQQTYHEMMYGFCFYTVEGEDLSLHVDPGTGWAM